MSDTYADLMRLREHMKRHAVDPGAWLRERLNAYQSRGWLLYGPRLCALLDGLKAGR